MANPRQRKKQSAGRKNTRRTADKRKRVNITGNKIIHDNWDKKATLRQNYARLGLMPSMNGVKGGVELNSEAEMEEMEEKSLEEMAAELSEEQGIIQRDAEGNIVKVIVGKKKTQEEIEEMMERDLPPAPAKTDIVRQLEAQAANVLKTERHQSDGELMWAAKLVEKYGDDYEKMFRDRKLNPMQQTVGQLRRKIASILSKVQ
ncbi:Nucleolar protein 16 [Actinomortierella ambigua]|uniref:Nucleolar protein 16 n=1 Tax=Actinomortierella ambigua TaxID=1343610 RepID=A0A9P6QE05_9FUNG|nr:Nucleolar protein 16 [Actinomortierella ambigua]KAG0263486.1 Nucleolar protein 16 [Actinomortierella ambigua]